MVKIDPSELGTRAFLDCSVHHLQSIHPNLSGRRVRILVACPEFSADVVSGDVAVPEEIELALSQVCPLPTALPGLVITKCHGPLTVDLRPPDAVLESAFRDTPVALTRARALGYVEEVKFKVTVLHVGGNGLTEVAATGLFTVDLPELLIADKVRGFRVPTKVGQVGIKLQISASDRDGFRRRLEGYMVRQSGQSKETVGARVAQMLSSPTVSEIFIFGQLRSKFENVAPDQRVRNFGKLYGLDDGAVTSSAARWAKHEPLLLSILAMAYGPEADSVPILTRLTEFSVHYDLDLYDVLRWLAVENFPEAKTLSDDRLEEKAETFFASREARAAAMARLVAKHGPEPSPSSYLYRQQTHSMRMALRLELPKQTTPQSVAPSSPNALSAAPSFLSGSPMHRDLSALTGNNAKFPMLAVVKSTDGSRLPSPRFDAASASVTSQSSLTGGHPIASGAAGPPVAVSEPLEKPRHAEKPREVARAVAPMTAAVAPVRSQSLGDSTRSIPSVDSETSPPLRDAAVHRLRSAPLTVPTSNPSDVQGTTTSTESTSGEGRPPTHPNVGDAPKRGRDTARPSPAAAGSPVGLELPGSTALLQQPTQLHLNPPHHEETAAKSDGSSSGSSSARRRVNAPTRSMRLQPYGARRQLVSARSPSATSASSDDARRDPAGSDVQSTVVRLVVSSAAAAAADSEGDDSLAVSTDAIAEVAPATARPHVTDKNSQGLRAKQAAVSSTGAPALGVPSGAGGPIHHLRTAGTTRTCEAQTDAAWPAVVERIVERVIEVERAPQAPPQAPPQGSPIRLADARSSPTRPTSSEADRRRRAAAQLRNGVVARPATREAATQADTGKAPPVIVAVPSGFGAAAGVAFADASLGERLWRLVQQLSDDPASNVSDGYMLTCPLTALHAFFGDRRVLPNVTQLVQAARVPVSSVSPALGLDPVVATAAAAFDAHRGAVLRHAATVTPCSISITGAAGYATSARLSAVEQSMRSMLEAFVEGCGAPAAATADLFGQRVVECSVGFAIHNRLLEDVFDRHVSLRRAHAPEHRAGASSVRRVFAVCQSLGDAVEAGTRGVEATVECPYSFSNPRDILRSALTPADAEATSLSRVWADEPRRRSTRVRPDEPIVVLVCDVYVGCVFRTVLGSVPKRVALRASLDPPFSWAGSAEDPAAGPWHGHVGDVFDSGLVHLDTPTEHLQVFSSQQVCVRGVLVLRAVPDALDWINASAAAINLAAQSVLNAARRLSPSRVGSVTFESSSSFAATRHLATEMSASSPSILDVNMPHPVRITAAHGPGTWAHEANAVSGGVARSVTDPRAKAIRDAIGAGWKLYGSGNVRDATRVWHEAARGGDDDTSSTVAERCARLEALGVALEAVKRDPSGAADAYYRALELEPDCTSALFRLGSVLETSLHRHYDALELFDRAAGYGDAAAARRATLLRKRLLIAGAS
jgi:hypothetical protein